jgi:hypothetical protein
MWTCFIPAPVFFFPSSCYHEALEIIRRFVNDEDGGDKRGETPEMNCASKQTIQATARQEIGMRMGKLSAGLL